MIVLMESFVCLQMILPVITKPFPFNANNSLSKYQLAKAEDFFNFILSIIPLQDSIEFDMIRPSCRGGGIGRRAGFKIRW